jgi:hypothetical protein
MAIKYYVATNTGKGFITHLENAATHIAGHPADIYVTENESWALRVGATEKTKVEAQALVDATLVDDNGDPLYELSGSYAADGTYSETATSDKVTYILP